MEINGYWKERMKYNKNWNIEKSYVKMYKEHAAVIHIFMYV